MNMAVFQISHRIALNEMVKYGIQVSIIVRRKNLLELTMRNKSDY